MGTLMQLLLEALRANVGDRNDESGTAEDQLPDEMSGFILENVQVATMPYIEPEEDEQPNPLMQLVRNPERPQRGTNPQNIHKILDHIVRLEKKVKVLERCIPPKTFQQRLWLAPTTVSEDDRSYDGSDYYPGEEEEDAEHAPVEKRHSGSRKGSHSSNSKSHRHGSPKAEEKASRVATRPIRLEKEERSCFARLLFSRCWTGKDHAAGWKIKRRCPTGAKGSLSCPCGQIGPCRKVKGHAVPIEKLKSAGPGNKKNTKGTASSGGSKISRRTACSKNQKTVENKKNNAASPQNAAKTNGKPLYEKLFPCCFRDHAHTECCCRCKDNPPLTDHKKSKEEVKKSSVPKLASAKSSADHASRKVASPEGDSATPSQDTGDEDGSDYDDQSEYQTYNIPAISNASPTNREKVNHLSRKHATGDIISKHKDYRRKIPHSAKKEAKPNMFWPESNNQFPPYKSTKSTTSFQIMLHPDISSDRIVEPEVVSHQILKTLSTIHGPVKVEQKIVVQGAKNSVVIVTHGEACQCNLCNMLKGKIHPNELIGGLSPQVVKISTDSGFNTLINHSDGCHCELCRFLDPASTKNTEHRTPQLENENLVMAACSASNEGGSVEKSPPKSTVQTLHSNDTQPTLTAPPVEIEPPKNGAIGMHSVTKKSKCKMKNGRKKATKCRCTKCRQRRRVDKLKLRLKKEMGSEEYNRVLQEIKRYNDDHDDRKTSKNGRTSAQSDSDDNHYVEPRRVTKKLVSFSDEPKREADVDEPETNEDSNETKRRCKLCELINMSAKQGNGISRKDKETVKIWRSQNHNSAVYSMNASSHEIPCDCQVYGSQIPKGNSDNQFRSKSKSSEKGVYGFNPEQQKCFPPDRSPKRARGKQPVTEKRMKDKITEEFSFYAHDTPRSPVQRGSSCSGRCREEANDRGKESSAILLQEGAFPQKFVYWAPGSRSNVATAYSSESYYVPDQDEFPIVNMECDDSVPSSGRNASSSGAPVHRVQIPIWFRMLPDRNSR